jgi:hypothetical protein
MDQGGIRRYAGRLRLGLLIASGLVLVLVACAHLGVRIAGAPVMVETRSADLGLFSVSDGTLLLLGVAVYWLSEALRAVAAGELFSRTVVRRFRLFALWMLIMALFSTIMPTVVSGMQPLPGGRHLIKIAIELRDLLLVGITLLLLLVARMFERARAIEDEMREIV